MYRDGIWIELGPDAASWRQGAEPADGRPHKVTAAGHVHWSLREEIHSWLIDRQVPYELSFQSVNDPAYLFNYRWLVWVADPDTAMLFKLTFA